MHFNWSPGICQRLEIKQVGGSSAKIMQARVKRVAKNRAEGAYILAEFEILYQSAEEGFEKAVFKYDSSSLKRACVRMNDWRKSNEKADVEKAM